MNAGDNGEYLFAALAYLAVPGDSFWPWDPAAYMPSCDPIDNFKEAAAFLVMEISRLERRRAAGLPVVAGLIMISVDAENIERTVEDLQQIRTELEALERECKT